ncbi:MAG TPA: hypothetical protein VMQ60_13830 [Acidobacteriaceae bacterium]|jgi:hypothetical protein|nr:hypothetical protein [Acidobacteriaceae bacterium]
MNAGLRSLLLLPLAALVACGSSSPSAAGGTAPTSGTYVLSITSGTSLGTTFTGGLNIAGSAVTGVFQFSNTSSACNGTYIPVTGTINSSNLLTLTSSVFAGNTVTITLQFPLTQDTTYTYSASGTAQIAAGSSGTNCAISSAPVSALYLAPYTGTWTGAISNGTVSGTATVVVSEPITTGTTFNLNASGQFPATGTLSFTSSTCTIASIALTGEVTGYTLQLNQSVSAPLSPIVVSASETTSPVTFNVLIPGSSSVTCPAGSYSGTITQ